MLNPSSNEHLVTKIDKLRQGKTIYKMQFRWLDSLKGMAIGHCAVNRSSLQ